MDQLHTLQLVKHHQLLPHAYANDTQIYGFCQPADSAELCEKVSVCVDHVLAWMASNRLQLNHAKIEVLWCSSSRRQHQILSSPVCIGSTHVQPGSSIRDLGVYIDADMTTMAHVTTVVRVSFTALHQIHSVRQSLSHHALLTLVHALIVSKIDYCKSVLTGISGQLQDRLHYVLNATAHLVFSARQ